MKIRNYSGTDFKQIVGMLKKDQPFLSIDENSFAVKVLCEENFSADGFFVAEEDGMIKGFCNTVCRMIPICKNAPDESKKGFITLFCVEDKSQVFSVGDKLLIAAQEYLIKLGKSYISTGYYPTYFSQGFSKTDHHEYISLFEKHGYSSSRSFSLKLELDNYKPDKSIVEKRSYLINNGFYIGELKPEYVLQLINPNAPFSNPSWSYEIKQRVIHNDYAKIRIAAINNKLVGAAPFCDPFGFDGRFGPFGVDAEFRGCGIGTVLLDDCLSQMIRFNVKTARMQWVSDSGAAYHIYEKAGFTKEREFITLRKIW